MKSTLSTKFWLSPSACVRLCVCVLREFQSILTNQKFIQYAKSANILHRFPGSIYYIQFNCIVMRQYITILNSIYKGATSW